MVTEEQKKNTDEIYRDRYTGSAEIELTVVKMKRQLLISKIMLYSMITLLVITIILAIWSRGL